MYGNLALIVLCGICIFPALADDTVKPCIFDFEFFRGRTNYDHVVLDYTGQKVTILKENCTTYRYVTGPVNAKTLIDNSYHIFLRMYKLLNGDNKIQMFHDVWEVCDFFLNIYPKYFLPIAGKHNDFPPQDMVCPIKKGTLNVYPVNSSKELVAPSILEEGRYHVHLQLTQDNRWRKGGFICQFKVIRK